MLTAEKAYLRVCSEVEKIRNDAPSTIETMSFGDVVRQGDIYLVCLDSEPSVIGPHGSNQLAPGTTQGSRHLAVGSGVEVLTVDNDKAISILNLLVPGTVGHKTFVGPMVRAPKGVTIIHPEHGHRTLPAASYLVVYQRAFADVIRRQLD